VNAFCPGAGIGVLAYSEQELAMAHRLHAARASVATRLYCKNAIINEMAWVVEILDDRVRDELATLPNDMLARFRRIVELIQGHGLEQVHEPHVKHLEGPLWEMRMTGRDGISRAIYVTASERRVVVLRVFVKKTQKTPRREIDLALARAKEVNR
jgi:phage-related protein